MTVALLPPATYSAVDLTVQALTEGPTLVRTRGMSRWHRPRSGCLYPGDRTVYSAWCGYGIGGSDRAGGILTAEEPPPGEPVCGTCEGRAAGAGQLASPTGRPLRYDPRDITPPRYCPGSRRALYLELPGGRVGQCLACGNAEPIRAMGGPYDSRAALVQHEPGGNLVQPCPFHRWRHPARGTDGHLYCTCGRPMPAPERTTV
jgi:hypothetical protein